MRKETADIWIMNEKAYLNQFLLEQSIDTSLIWLNLKNKWVGIKHYSMLINDIIYSHHYAVNLSTKDIYLVYEGTIVGIIYADEENYSGYDGDFQYAYADDDEGKWIKISKLDKALKSYIYFLDAWENH